MAGSFEQELCGGLYIGEFEGREIVLSTASSQKDLCWNDAVEYCSSLELNGFSDWFLPSKEELEFIRSKIRIINEKSSYRFCEHYYWSSSVSGSHVWAQNFSEVDDDKDIYVKSDVGCVRAIRSLPV